MMDSANIIDPISSASGHHKLNAVELSYKEMTTDESGQILSVATKKAMRKHLGYCLTCPRVPVLLFDIKRSRMNPLRTIKKPRSVDGECCDGMCFKCKPELNPSRSTATLPPPSLHSTKSAESVSSVGSSRSVFSQCSTSHDPHFDGHRSIGVINRCSSSGAASQQHRGGACMPPRHHSQSVHLEQRQQNPPPRSQHRRVTPPRRCGSNDGQTSMGTSRKGTRGTKSAMSRSYSGDSLSFTDSTSFAEGTLPEDHVVAAPRSPRKGSQDLASLRAIFLDMKATGCAEILSESIISSMDSHHGEKEVQIFCMEKIAGEFDEEDGFDSAVFVSLNGDLRVMDAMKSFRSSLDVQERGCTAIGVLAVNELNREDLVRHGVCTYLVKALALHLGDTALVASAFVALRILSTHIDARQALQRLELPKIVVEAMECNMSDSSIPRDGCAILSNLVVDAESKQVALVAVSEVAVIVQAMEAHPRDESINASACFALKNFTFNDSNLRTMAMVDGIIDSLENASNFDSIFTSEQTLELVFISRAQDESVVEEAHKTLKAEVAQESDDPEVMVYIIDMMRNFSWSARIVEVCLKMLKALALTSEPHKSKFMSTMTLEKLQSYGENFATSRKIQNEIAVLLGLFQEN